ncbi:MAG TPA: hypothetical protein VNY35_07435 [Solirubrobacteraceae bacterium]|jgi:hypothetical protein|nr:hypothetical protein [Solirubrobacteraceae bacterium]
MTKTNTARRASNGARAAREQVGLSPRPRDGVVGAGPAPDTPLRPSIAFDQATRPSTGLPALALLCAFSALPAIAAVVLLANEQLIWGYVVLGLSLVSLAFLLSAISRVSSGPLGHRALTVGGRARLRGRVVCTSVRAWSRAVGALIRARRGQQRLHAARKDRVAALAEAILCGDRARAALLTAETRVLREESQAREEEAGAAIRSAREQIQREREAGSARVVVRRRGQ